MICNDGSRAGGKKYFLGQIIAEPDNIFKPTGIEAHAL